MYIHVCPCLSVYCNIYYIYFNPSSSFFWKIVRHSFPNAAIPSRGAIIFRTGAGSFSFSLLFLQLDQEKESRRECEVVRVDRTKIHGVVVGATIYRDIGARVPGTRSQC